MDEAHPPTRLEATIELACSPAEAWRYLGDFDEVGAWAPAITEAHRTTGEGISVGSRRTVRYRGLFRMEQMVTEWWEGQRLEYAVFKAPWPLRRFIERWEVTPAVTGARVHAQVSYDLWFGPVGELVNWLFTRHVLRFEMRLGLEGLKRAVESGVLRRPRNGR